MRPSRQEINSLVNRYLEGEITKVDFDSFLEGLDKPEVRKIYSEILKSSFEERLNQNNAYSITSKKEHFSHQIGKYWMGIAATILLVSCLSFLIYQNLQPSDNDTANIHQTAFSEQKNILLPDGTEVNLNVISSLEQLEFENQEMRKVKLQGEAYFNVAKNKSKPFEISTQAVKILVLGTAFNVKSYDEDALIDVAVTEGIVRVSLVWGDFVVNETLTLGQKISIDKAAKTYEIREFNEPIYWKTKVLNFEQAEFSEVIKSLERWYGINLAVKDSSLNQLKLSGQFKNKSIQEVISAIGFLTNNEAPNEEFIQVISEKSSSYEN